MGFGSERAPARASAGGAELQHGEHALMIAARYGDGPGLAHDGLAA